MSKALLASINRRGYKGWRTSRMCIPCTKDGSTRCQLLERCHDFNEILLDAGLEVREDSLGKHSGDVCIGVVRASSCGHVFNSCKDLRQRRALKVVKYLLSKHHCITALELNGNARQRRSLLVALKNCRSLKSLTVCTVDRTKDAAFLTKVINSFFQVDELAFKAYHCDREWNWRTTHIRDNSLNLYVHRLTTLNVTDLQMSFQEASRFTGTLIQNNTITDLTVGCCVFDDHSELFAQYLGKKGSTLRKLTLKSMAEFYTYVSLTTLVEAMCKMTSLEELNVDILLRCENLVRTVALFARMATTSKTLRRLRLPSTVYNYCRSCASYHTAYIDPNSAQCMQPWLAALQSSEFVLSELCIDLRGFSEVECHAFFYAVADNSILSSVTVNTIDHGQRINYICGTIWYCNLVDRVTIKDLYIDQENIKVILYCPEITTATIGVSHLVCKEGNLLPVRWALKVISHCLHITSLRVNCDRFDRTAFSALAACLRGPSALTDVDIDLGSRWTEVVEEERRGVEAELVSSLASNTNLARLSLRGALLSSNDLNLLADGARKSRYLTDFCLNPACISGDVNGGSCTWHAAERLNTVPVYTNIVLATMQDIMRHNIALVEAAVKYVLSEGETDTGARVVEVMRSHPRFLELVLEATGGSKTKAKMMIRRALQRVRRISLHEFMRLAGVVREKVQCLDSLGAGTQLCHLSVDCWLHIRSFLKIADVVQA